MTKFNNLTQEELKQVKIFTQMNLEKSKLMRVEDTVLNEKVECLIEENRNQLKGDYIFYCLYEEENVKYALIYADYVESSTVRYKDMHNVILEDGKFMHGKLKEAKLDCDYFFIVPYFKFTNKEKGNVMINHRACLTNKLEEFEQEPFL